ncbi:MAG: pyridoxal-phosphate dependent enzyme [Candidatus Aenigmarchaeota archaeon]|nr:pyridoxal-phosphate dependent enzyme [Candidatus Aenigmarchaeota archaeon]
MPKRPTLKDVLKARRMISNYLYRSPLYQYPALNSLLGCELYIKHENHQPTGSFKVRGGINLISQLSETEKRLGVITASSGNHGISISYASRLFGVQAKVALPEGANPGKAEFIKSLGAELIYHGKNLKEAREHAECLAEEEGSRYIHFSDEPMLISGVGTHTLEILEDLPDANTIIVPVGGGTGACGACIVTKHLIPDIEVIACQAEKAPAAYRSWKEGRIVEAEVETFADGLATKTGYELTVSILKELLDDFVLVSEESMLQAIALLFYRTHNLAEGAGASSLAAAIKYKDRFQGKKVVIILTGGNITPESLQRALTYSPA